MQMRRILISSGSTIQLTHVPTVVGERAKDVRRIRFVFRAERIDRLPLAWRRAQL